MKGIILTVLLLLGLLTFPSNSLAEGPIGYPWFTWGELSQTWDHTETGIKFDTYLEQGIDWLKIGNTNWIFNSFAGVRLVQSDQSDYWNNKIGPWFGIKFKLDFRFPKLNYGQIAIGARGEHYSYTRNSPGSDLRGLVFIQYSAGGDWKK